MQDHFGLFTKDTPHAYAIRIVGTKTYLHNYWKISSTPKLYTKIGTVKGCLTKLRPKYGDDAEIVVFDLSNPKVLELKS